MIGKISGILAYVGAGTVIVETGGVGYEIRIPLSAMENLPPTGEHISFVTHTYVREDVIELYGFPSFPERDLFRVLINISGIGPKNAMAMLTHLTPKELLSAILTERSDILTKVPGIGKKSADRLILELKSRAKKLFPQILEGEEATIEQPATNAARFLAEADLAMALESLGYKKATIERAIQTLSKTMPYDAKVEDLIKEALKEIR